MEVITAETSLCVWRVNLPVGLREHSNDNTYFVTVASTTVTFFFLKKYVFSGLFLEQF